MPKSTKFKTVSNLSINELRKTAANIEKESLKVQKEKIKQMSPYSNDINCAFSGYNEFYYLYRLGLQEITVTRPVLARNIDLDLYVTEKGKTNYELMLEGASPYAEDTPEGCIVLHHIGQGFDAPFAELTEAEHASFGNSKILHNNKLASWRNDENKVLDFQKEKIQYWRQRINKSINNNNIVDMIEKDEFDTTDNIAKIKEPLEKLFAECSIDDLIYISNLANGYILLKEVKASTVEEFIISLGAKEKGKGAKCPTCESKKIIYYGYTAGHGEKKQRYRCNDCGAVFNLFSNTIISGCSLSLLDWMKFIDCLYNGYSIKKTSLICDLSEKTCFDLRLKLFYALKILDEKIKLEGKIVLDETYLRRSEKGNHTQQKGYTLGRAPRKRGKQATKKGLSTEHICIMCALDEHGNSVARIAGYGSPNHKKINIALKDCFNKPAVEMLVSDSSGAIKLFAQKNRYPIIQTKFDIKKKRVVKNPRAFRYVQKINAYHSRLKAFVSHFNGVSTDMLAGYMNLFSWRDRNRGNPPIEAYRELLEVMVTPNKNVSSKEILKEHIGKNPALIEAVSNLKSIRNKEKYDKIYALYAKGMPQKQIAKKYNCTPQAISKAINKYIQAGFGYRTEKEKRKEQERLMSPGQRRAEYFETKRTNTYERDGEILEAFEKWDGDKEKFYSEMLKKYGLKKQTIKNRVCEAKRIRALKKVFYINEDYNFIPLKELFELIYKNYIEMTKQNPNMTLTTCYAKLAEEFGYTSYMIMSIIKKMKGEEIDWNAKKKTPISQTLNRDISVFIDYMKWVGTKKEFFEFAKKKYNLESGYVSRILAMNCLAEPSRYERIKEY